MKSSAGCHDWESPTVGGLLNLYPCFSAVRRTKFNCSKAGRLHDVNVVPGGIYTLSGCQISKLPESTTGIGAIIRLCGSSFAGARTPPRGQEARLTHIS